MSSQQKAEDGRSQAADDQKEGSPVAAGLGGQIIEQYGKIKEHAETYPYVWGSYILVYGGLSLWLVYRWRTLRKTEDRIRVLQERLRKQYEAEELSKSTKVSDKPANSIIKPPPSADKPAK